MAKRTKTKKADGGLDLRVDLNPEIADLLMEIMNERKFQYKAEAIRYCIVETSTKTEFHLPEVYWNKIKSYLAFDYVKNKRHIYNMQEFVNKALENFFDTVESSVQSIMSFDIRSDLKDLELNIAMAVIECQETSYQHQVTVQDVADHMNKRKLKEIEDVLEAFVSRGILSRLIHSQKVYYHARPVHTF